jgi:hypothetical protein
LDKELAEAVALWDNPLLQKILGEMEEIIRSGLWECKPDDPLKDWWLWHKEMFKVFKENLQVSIERRKAELKLRE